MKLCQLNIVKNIPFKPYVKVDGEFIKVPYKVLWKMYDRVDYVLRVIGQVVEGYPNGVFSKGELLTLVYGYVKNGQSYIELRESVVGMLLKVDEGEKDGKK